MNSNNKILSNGTNRIEILKSQVINDMNKRNIGAIFWNKYLFGSTSYPLINGVDGKEYEVKGLCLDKYGVLYAISKYPSMAAVPEVKTYSPKETIKKILADVGSDVTLNSEGSPEQWGILCDCYNVAVQTLIAEKDKTESERWL